MLIVLLLLLITEAHMNAEQLYQEMKDALDYFGLSFHSKDHVVVTIEGNKLIFSYNNRSVAVTIP